MTELNALTHPPIQAHPNIVDFLGLAWGNNPFNPAHKLPVIVVEYAEHGTLADLLKAAALSQIERGSLCLDVALGLQVIHECGLVHGDIKSQNVLVFTQRERKYIAKLADFGFSAVEVDEKETTLPGYTWPWNAPEYGSRISTERLRLTDVYSFGLLVWVVAIDGQNPFDLITTGQNRDQEIRDLKVTNTVLRLSKLSHWYVKWYTSRTHLEKSPATPLEEGLAEYQSLSSVASEGFLSSILREGQCALFYGKLEEVFEYCLKIDPTQRDIKRVIEILRRIPMPHMYVSLI